MGTSAVAATTTALLLGVTHGIEPDHVAAIASVSGRTPGDRRSMLLGGFFAAGHVLLVLIWVGIAYTVLDVSTYAETVEVVGTVVVGVLLVLLGGVLGSSLMRQLLHTHEHEHEGDRHSHFHVHVPSTGNHSVLAEHDHDHTWRAYLRIGTVGALFTLSPPLSMITFISLLVPNTGTELVSMAILSYVIAITATMVTVGFGVSRLFDVSRSTSRRVYVALQTVTAVLVIGFGVFLLRDSVPDLLASL